MLEPKLKNLRLIYLFIGHEEGVNIVEEYDKQLLYPMFLKCYHHLHAMTKSRVKCVDQIGDMEYDLDIFEQPPNTSEVAIEIITREMLIFRCYQVDSKEFKCHVRWWAKHEAMFPIVDCFA